MPRVTWARLRTRNVPTPEAASPTFATTSWLLGRTRCTPGRRARIGRLRTFRSHSPTWLICCWIHGPAAWLTSTACVATRPKKARRGSPTRRTTTTSVPREAHVFRPRIHRRSTTWTG